MLVLLIIIVFLAAAAGLAWYLIAHDRGEREPVNALWVAFGLGFGGGVAAMFLEQLISPNALIGGAGNRAMLLAFLGVGVIEEACKFVPLAFFIYRKRYFNELTDGVIYFALAGLGFGLPENLLYTVGYGASAGIMRVLLTPLFHSAITALVGYYLIRGKLHGQGIWLAVLALMGAMGLHGFYDFGLSSASGLLNVASLVITLGLSAYLFILYANAGEQDAREGRSSAGRNKFCRTCGLPNGGHHLYCTRCGNYA